MTVCGNIVFLPVMSLMILFLEDEKNKISREKNKIKKGLPSDLSIFSIENNLRKTEK